MEPLAITQGQLAKAMGVSRRMINEICNKAGAHTAMGLCIIATMSVNHEVVLKISPMSIWYGKVYAVDGRTADAGHYRHHAFSWAAGFIGAA